MHRLLKEYVKLVLAEVSEEDAIGAFYDIRILNKGPNTSEVLADIRGILGVITVNQQGASRPAPEGKSIVRIKVTYDAGRVADEDVLFHSVRKINGIDMVVRRKPS